MVHEQGNLSIFQRFPALALLGFFPPVYIIGVLLVVFAAVKHICKEGINDFFDMFVVGAILVAPLWPLIHYRGFKYEKELRQRNSLD